MTSSIDTYRKAIDYLESLSIMPKTMPGLEKMKLALQEVDWFYQIDADRVIVVAGTNGKGTTAAALESLLASAGKKAGLYTSPHFLETTERIRINKKDITQKEFFDLFCKNLNLIQKYQLTHFESLTLIAADYFFNRSKHEALDYVIMEVGLGGLYDATNAFPHKYSVITKIGLDHQNILGNTILEIAKNKLGIVHEKNVVVHHKMEPEVEQLMDSVLSQTGSIRVPLIDFEVVFNSQYQDWECHTKKWGPIATNMVGPRGVENIATAMTLFDFLGYDLSKNKWALSEIAWPGRMSMIHWPNLNCPTYISGDHNIQGIQSLVEILKNYKWNNLHIVVGIGAEKESSEMLEILSQLKNVQIYLTETPFKGKSLDQYEISESVNQRIKTKNKEVVDILNSMSVKKNDLVIITGSLYLVGKVLKLMGSQH